MEIIKKGKCPSLSNKSTLTSEIGRDEDGAIQLSMITSMEPFRDRFIGATLGSV